MKNKISAIIISLIFTIFIYGKSEAKDTDRQSYKIFVDKDGKMKRSDTGEEVSYFGTNYTVPFAHAYRALGYLEKDRKEAIDKDVYHMKRLGFNGFRLHLWDVELADSLGNLIENEHLELLDYLISKLEENNIDIILTAQTNFGNGYPERNIDTGSFTYDFDKCHIHEDKEAQKIQENYLRQLVTHINPYTGRSYADDNAIIAMEINNEPCHSGSKKEVTGYINRMVKALKKSGFDKPILYNVSHNPEVTEAYYEADIQGTTYQWYPTGLVAGHERKGNFLLNVSEYEIPWKDSMKNYDKMAKVVYEFDPGDVLYSYLYPAIARTFRKEGFQWATQFAYDPIELAEYNTEYQTHFLNLAYTPSKAISMAIAAEAMREIPLGSDYGKFPKDTVFGNFKVSYINDYSLYNSPEKYYYSNTVTDIPVSPANLRYIKGHGSSPIVDYEGSGAYFIDATDREGVWRVEVMPDVVLFNDPFERPSLKKSNADIFYMERPMRISLPNLGERFSYIAVNEGNVRNGETIDATFNVYPGVYLLAKDKAAIESALSDHEFVNDNLKTFVAPGGSEKGYRVVHNPPLYFKEGEDLKLIVKVFGKEKPESVYLYPSFVSFWRDDNPIIKLEKEREDIYSAVIPNNMLQNSEFKYNIVVNSGDEDYTFPQVVEGNPLDWDFTDVEYYTIESLPEGNIIPLLTAETEIRNIETAMIPEAWNYKFEKMKNSPIEKDVYEITVPENAESRLFIKIYTGDFIGDYAEGKTPENINISLRAKAGIPEMSISLTGKNGSTVSSSLSDGYLINPGVKLVDESQENGEREMNFRIPLERLKASKTPVIPAPYPTFLPRETDAIEAGPILPQDIELVIFSIDTPGTVTLENIWLE